MTEKFLFTIIFKVAGDLHFLLSCFELLIQPMGIYLFLQKLSYEVVV